MELMEQLRLISACIDNPPHDPLNENETPDRSFRAESSEGAKPCQGNGPRSFVKTGIVI